MRSQADTQVGPGFSPDNATKAACRIFVRAEARTHMMKVNSPRILTYCLHYLTTTVAVASAKPSDFAVTTIFPA
jgi:hypothetical protein